MPKIQEYGIQTTAQGPGGILPVADYSGTGRVVAAGANQWVDIEQQRQVQSELFQAGVDVANGQAEWTNKLNERLKTADPGDPDIAKKFLEEFDQYAGDLVGNATTAQGQQYYRENIARLRGSLSVNINNGQSALAGVKAKGDFEAARDTRANTVMSNPGLLQQSLDQSALQLKMLQESGLISSNTAEELQQNSESTLTAAALSGQVEQNPQAALKELNSGKYDELLDPGKKMALIGAAEQEIKRREAQARSEAREAQAIRRAETAMLYQDEMAMASDGKASALVTREDLIRDFGADKGARAWSALESERQLAVDKTGLALATPEERAAKIEEYTPVAGPGYEAAASRRNELLAADTALQNEREDPGNYVWKYSPEFRSALNAATSDPAKLPEAMALSDQVQADIGIPAHERRLLPKSWAEDTVAKIEAAPAEETGKTIQGLAEAYGDAYWPRIYRELKEAGLPGGSSTLAIIDDPRVRTEAARVIKVPMADLKSGSGLDDAALRDADEKVDAVLAPFRTSLNFAPNREAAYAEVRDVVHRLTLSNGGDAQAAADGVVNKKFDFVVMAGINARAPKGFGADAEYTARGVAARITVDMMPEVEGAPELTSDQRRRLYFNTLKSGQWISNEDDDGWLFTDPNGRPVVLKDGSRVEFLFEDMVRAPTDPFANSYRPGLVPQ